MQKSSEIKNQKSAIKNRIVTRQAMQGVALSKFYGQAMGLISTGSGVTAL
jgi:hypothetical protein